MSAIQFKTLDVRPLLAKGTEPRAAILKRVAEIGPGDGLEVIAPFLPAPLIERLRSEGFASSVERRADGGWAARFWRE